MLILYGYPFTHVITLNNSRSSQFELFAAQLNSSSAHLGLIHVEMCEKDVKINKHCHTSVVRKIDNRQLCGHLQVAAYGGGAKGKICRVAKL